MSAAAEVYRSPELMRLILEQLDRRHCWKMLVLENSFLPAAVDVLWREVPYSAAQEVLPRFTASALAIHPSGSSADPCAAAPQPRATIYAEAIRTITLLDPPFPSDETSQMALVTSLAEDFPYLQHAYRRSKSRPWSYEWKLDIKPSGICDVDLRAEFSVEDGTEPSELDEEQIWYPGYEVRRSIVIKFDKWSGDSRQSIFLWSSEERAMERTKNTWVRYLTDSSQRHPSICAVDFGRYLLSPTELERVLGYRHENHLPVTEVRAAMDPSFDIDGFERWCRSVGGVVGEELEVLQLDARLHVAGARLLLSSFDRVIQTVAQCFPALRSLELPLAISFRGGTVRVTDVKVASHVDNKLRRLSRVVIAIDSGPGFGQPRDARYPFPVEDVAQNLAQLGAGPDCTYELRNNTDIFLGMNVSRALNQAVHEYQRLAPDGQITLHANDVPPAYDGSH